MRLATWNVNSIKSRLPRVVEWLAAVQPDVLAVQELKCAEVDVPLMEFADLGYEVAALGDGRWNGVALLSRIGLDDVTRNLPDQPPYDGSVEPRAIGAVCGGVRVWSVYVPNGREPGHDHYAYKLAWFDALAAMARAETAADPDRPFAIIGDFNVAPNDDDVWDITLFGDSTHVTPAERAALATLDAAGLAETVPRALKGAPYTFWDYRDGAFHKGKGMRIDLVYGNSAFRSRIRDAYVDREARKGAGPSDHAPVVVELTD